MVMLSAQWYALGLPKIIRKDKTIQIFALVDLGSHSPLCRVDDLDLQRILRA